MPTPTLRLVEDAVRTSWGADTTYASDDYLRRGAGHPARGQCGPTALVVYDLLGGELVVADLEHAGVVDAVHYWNALPDGTEVDLTRDQLVEGERLLRPRRVVVPAVRSSPGEVPYRVLRSRVARLLRPEG
ncbi:hypothetical protein [uncultured Pseudokineococcus sp.]|uniref:YunG family protein n=1 Tax=uncultured Pseudokineococcus sp. TaxID=1642928 RepID=UPI0026271D25|nr:hypothetical protein [uncultured Pseudokineococcus sp.]